MKNNKIQKSPKIDKFQKLAIKKTDTKQIKGGFVGFEDIIDA